MKYHILLTEAQIDALLDVGCALEDSLPLLKMNEHYGPCPQCGAEIVTANADMTQEFWSNPEWRGIYCPPPPGSGQMDGAEYTLSFVCKNRHQWDKTEIKWFEKPIKGTF